MRGHREGLAWGVLELQPLHDGFGFHVGAFAQIGQPAAHDFGATVDIVLDAPVQPRQFRVQFDVRDGQIGQVRLRVPCRVALDGELLDQSARVDFPAIRADIFEPFPHNQAHALVADVAVLDDGAVVQRQPVGVRARQQQEYSPNHRASSPSIVAIRDGRRFSYDSYGFACSVGADSGSGW